MALTNDVLGEVFDGDLLLCMALIIVICPLISIDIRLRQLKLGFRVVTGS